MLLFDGKGFYMKKFIAALLSMIMIFSVGTTTALAEPGVDVMSATEGETPISEPKTEENTQDLTEEEPSEEITTEDEIGLESDDVAEAGDAEENEDSELLDSLVEEEEEFELEEEEEETEADEEDEIETEELSIVLFDAEDYVDYIILDPIELSYDDRFDLSSEYGFPTEGTYEIYKTEFEEGEEITSRQVSNGTQGERDTDLLTFKEEGSTTVIASGVGSGTVWLVRDDQTDDLDEILELEEGLESGELDPFYVNVETATTEDFEQDGLDGLAEDNPEDDATDGIMDLDISDADSVIPSVITDPEDMITVYQIHVTVKQAPLTLMFLTGQSNMEGSCSSSTGYQLGASVACEAGTVYSTYAPSSASNGANIGGVREACTASNASEFVAGSLQEGTNMSGGELPYSINSLTTEGNGKTGPDSGLAFEWNQLTGDKVWVINTAYGGSNISSWIPGGSNYQRSAAVWEEVLNTYSAEVGNHYTAGEKLVFWLQGETGDRTLAAEAYESYFSNMYYSISSVIDPKAFGIIMVRASNGSYTTDDEWNMTGPRIAQYWLGSGESGYSNVYVVSNVNEQWVSDSGVDSYFENAYPGGSLSYPMHGGDSSLPETVSEVHSDIHYSQVGHNENGITAAEGMYSALYGGTSPTDVSWRDEAGQDISSVSFELGGETTTMVETVDPSYAAKNVSYDYGSCASYDGATATLTGIETGTVMASYNGSTLSELTVNVTQSADLTNVVGKNYTGFYTFNDVTWYLIDSYIQVNYEGVEQDTKKVIDSSAGWWYVKDGRLDKTYTGFAENSNGWWYIENGKVTFNKNSVIQDTNKKINGSSDWWYVVGSKVQEGFTGLADYSNSSGWWYIEKGKVSFTYSGVEQNTNGWFYIQDSKVDFSYNGFAHNSNGWWYIENGKVTFKKNSVILDSNKKVDGTSSWWYVVESKVQTTFTGLADYSNSNGWWYIESGKVSFTKDTIAHNKNGWWYVKDSKVDFNFTGLADFPNSNGWWYCENGKVTFKKDTIAKNKNGWWYIKDSKVDFSFTGLADFPNENGWWYCQDGKVNFNYNGIARNKNGWWYVKDSKVDFSFTGTVTAGGRRYSVTNGKVNR